MVDANGKPYESNRVNNVTDKSASNSNSRPSEPIYEDAFVGLVANLNPYHHLNW
jgi:hypothetical protein